MDINIEQFLRQDAAEKKRRRGGAPGNKRPKSVLMPSELRGKKGKWRDPVYRPGPVITYNLKDLEEGGEVANG